MAKKQFQVIPAFGNWGFTVDGGLYETYINRTGNISVKGTIVVSSTTYDNAVETAPTNSDMPIGILYENDVPDGSLVKVVVGGRAQVLMLDTIGSNSGYWCGASPTAGRMYQTEGTPTSDHWKEIGHSMETAAGGINVLAWVNLHFN